MKESNETTPILRARHRRSAHEAKELNPMKKHVELHDVELGHAQSDAKRPKLSYEERYDLVLVFPRPADDPQKGKASDFTQDRFVDEPCPCKHPAFRSSETRTLPEPSIPT